MPIDDNTQKINNQNNSTNISNTDHYLAVLLLSIIGYIMIAVSTKVNLLELVDLEIPLIILLSLIIVYLSTNYNRLVVYLIYSFLTILILVYYYKFAFFFIISLFSELIIYTINKIVYNKNDYGFR